MNEDNTKEKNIVENIEDIGIPNMPDLDNPIQFLTIIGEIEGHSLSPSVKKTTKYEHIIPLLMAATQNPKIKGILIVLNTVGGDVEAGLALAEMIYSIK